jgi:hypothetical protein
VSVKGLCRSIDDARELRLALLDELRHVVRFDAYAWLLTDPETEVGTAPIADVPSLPDLPRTIRLKYATDVNRWTTLTDPVGRLQDVTGGRPERSRMWRELLRAHDVDDVASIVFRDRFGCWSFLDLWRCGGDFGEEEARQLTTIVPTVTDALRRCVLRSFDTSADDPLGGAAASRDASPGR